jgi:hypothetical protein
MAPARQRTDLPLVTFLLEPIEDSFLVFGHLVEFWEFLGVLGVLEVLEVLGLADPRTASPRSFSRR